MKKALFVFATRLELQGLFPNQISESELAVNKLIDLPVCNAKGACLGVGCTEFAAKLAGLLSECVQKNQIPSVVILLGICGAYPQSGIQVGEVVRVVSETVGDLGYQDADGTFSSWANRCSYESSVQIQDKSSLPAGVLLSLEKIRQVRGLSVNCCTGTAETAKNRFETFGCAVESMEGAALFSICNAFGIPSLEIRAVSNIASTRDKSLWRISYALEKLRLLFT